MFILEKFFFLIYILDCVNTEHCEKGKMGKKWGWKIEEPGSNLAGGCVSV